MPDKQTQMTPEDKEVRQKMIDMEERNMLQHDKCVRRAFEQFLKCHTTNF
jgi:hypothetical protein